MQIINTHSHTAYAKKIDILEGYLVIGKGIEISLSTLVQFSRVHKEILGGIVKNLLF